MLYRESTTKKIDVSSGFCKSRRYFPPTCIESLKAILTSENSPLNEEIEEFKKLGVTLSYEESYLDAICNKALSLKTGARSLKTILEENIRGYKLEVLFNMGKYDEIILNGECIDNPKKATIIDRVDNNQLVLKR